MDSLPTDDILTLDDELEQAFQEYDPDAEVEVEIVEPSAYGRTWKFDFATRRMVRQGQGVAQIQGIDTLRQWIELTISVAAGAHPIFPDDYGVDDPDLMVGEAYSPALEAEFAEQIREALLFHDKIKSVTGFRFEYNDEEAVLYYSFVVHTDEDDEEAIEISSSTGVYA
jgi:hypothetical protein